MDLKDKEGKCWIFKDGKIKEHIFTLISTEGEEFSINFGYIDDIKFFTDYVKYHGKDVIEFKEFATSKVLKNYVTYKTSGKLKYKDLLEECEEFGEYILDTKFRYDVFMISNDLKALEKVINLDQTYDSQHIFTRSKRYEKIKVKKSMQEIHNSCYDYFKSLHNKSDFYRLILPAAAIAIRSNLPQRLINKDYLKPVTKCKTFMTLNTEDSINLMKKLATIIYDYRDNDSVKSLREAIEKEFK